VTTEPVEGGAADSANQWDGGEADVLSEAIGPRWREPKVRRAFIGLLFVIGIFVIAPVAAMLAAAN